MATKKIFGKKNNSGKISVIVLTGGVLLSSIVLSCAPNDAGETSSADAIIAEATPVPGSRVTPVLEPMETPASDPTVTPIVLPVLDPTPEPTTVPTPIPTATPTPQPTPIPTLVPTEIPTPQPTMEPQTQPDSESTAQSMGGTGSEHGNSNFDTYDNQDQQQTEDTYVLNTSSMKIHHPGCSSVPKIAPRNYATSSESIGDLQAKGYSTCGICFK